MSDFQQPQTAEEIRPFVEALKRLDGWVDVLWEPKARIVKRPGFDASGRRTGSEEYEGRWRVIRYNTDRLHLDREYTVIVEVTEFDGTTLNLMKHQGKYEPMSWKVVEYMQRFDAAQARFAEEMDKVWLEHEQAESLDSLIKDSAAHQEAAEKVYREHGGGEYWMGRGFGPGQFGKGHRAVDVPEVVATITP